MDYDPSVVSDILDYMFKPGFGLDLDILKVEMGGDTDSTEVSRWLNVPTGTTSIGPGRVSVCRRWFSCQSQRWRHD